MLIPSSCDKPAGEVTVYITLCAAADGQGLGRPLLSFRRRAGRLLRAAAPGRNCRRPGLSECLLPAQGRCVPTGARLSANGVRRPQPGTYLSSTSPDGPPVSVAGARFRKGSGRSCQLPNAAGLKGRMPAARQGLRPPHPPHQALFDREVCQARNPTSEAAALQCQPEKHPGAEAPPVRSGQPDWTAACSLSDCEASVSRRRNWDVEGSSLKARRGRIPRLASPDLVREVLRVAQRPAVSLITLCT